MKPLDIILFIFCTSVLLLVIWPRQEKGKGCKNATGTQEPTGSEEPVKGFVPAPEESREKHRRHERKYWLISTLASALAAGAAGYAAYLAFHALESSREATRNAKDTEKRQLRAYVGLKSLTLDCPDCLDPAYVPKVPRVGDINRNYVVVEVHHSGATPAKELQIWLNWQPVPRGFELPPDFPFIDGRPAHPRPFVSKTVVHPNATYESKVAIFDARPVIAARNHIVQLYFYGHIDYIDIFGNDRQTIFCWVYEPFRDRDRITVPYSRHNDAT